MTDDLLELDHKLRNPLFYAPSTTMVLKLIQMVQNSIPDKLVSFINHKDQNLDTPLLYLFKKGHWEQAEALAKNKNTNVKEQNRIRYTALHHMGKYRGKISAPDCLVKILVGDGSLLGEEDINGQTALHLASIAGNATIVEFIFKSNVELINSKDKCDITPLDLSASQEIYDIMQPYAKLTGTLLQNRTKMFQWREEIRENTETYHTGSLDQLLQKKGLGHLPESGEVDDIKDAVQMVIECLKVGMKEIDPDLEFEWMPSGSVKEGSKVNMPDEFDFMNKILLLVKFVRRTDTSNVGASYTKLQQIFQSEVPENLKTLFESNYLVVDHLFKRFYSNGQILLSLEALWEVCGNLYRVKAGDISGSKTKISDLKLYWHGVEYPWLEISVDIVPALKFLPNINGVNTHCTDLLSETQTDNNNIISSHLAEYGYCVVAKRVDHASEDEKKYLFQLSFSESEAALMKSPEMASDNGLDAYKLSKIVRNKVFCKEVVDGKGEPVKVSEHITSYMLKNTLFHLHASKDLHPNGHPLRNAIKLFERLKQYLQNASVPMFFLPEQNIIEQYWKGKSHPDWSKHLEYAQQYCDDIVDRLKKNE